MATRVLDEDLARVWGDRFDRWTGKSRDGVIRMLYWGDEVDLVSPAEATDPTVKDVRVRVFNYPLQKLEPGVIRKKKKNGQYVPLRFRTGSGKHLLEVTFVDVQQGDATVVRTPDRKLMLIDGGEQKFIARALASMHPHTTAADPLIIDYLVITHGDADHFSGLVEVARASGLTDHRELHCRVKNYFHNGLVKGPSSRKVNGKSKQVPDRELFGQFKKVGKTTYATELWSDPRSAPEKNQPFREWCDAMETLLIDGQTVVDRIEYGDDAVFDALRPAVDVEVLGPIVEDVGGPALPFLGGTSASHTINGHSVVLRLRHGNVHFLMGGDLNTDAEERLREHLEQHPDRSLRAEVFKVPHHGSHEFEPAFLQQVNPVVSVVSSGDENPSKEYVHPRASLMAALGRASRGPVPLLFSTELAAFFAYRGSIQPELHEPDAHGELQLVPQSRRLRSFHAFDRLVWGAVRVRTDGERVLVAVESASANIKEAYAFRVDSGGNSTPEAFSLL